LLASGVPSARAGFRFSWASCSQGLIEPRSSLGYKTAKDFSDQYYAGNGAK
jgi:hypothetical protein